jgi:ubiquinone/menaquinone biosynthesis C-methylase UbiE
VSDSEVNNPLTQEVDQFKESRKARRRKTMAPITPVSGPIGTEKAFITNVSLNGAYVKTDRRPPIDSRVVFSMALPSGWKHPIQVGGRVVRIDDEGIGILFEDLLSKDRYQIRQYASFVDLDDAVVSLQGALQEVLTGNLLPISDWELIEQRLKDASDKSVDVLVLPSADRKQSIPARLEYHEGGLRLRDLKQPLPKESDIIYCALLDGPLHAVFEGLITEHGDTPAIRIPERMYHNDRRCSRRFPAEGAMVSIRAPHLPENEIRFPVVDISEGGCAIQIPKESMITVGMRFPRITLTEKTNADVHDGATITRIEHFGDNDWLVGLNFLDIPENRDAFQAIQNRNVNSSFLSTLYRLSGLARKKLTDLVGGKAPSKRSQVYVCRYKNTKRESVAAILDATFDLHETPPPVDVAVVICQPFQIRKEVFSLLARTLVDNFKRDGVNAVVLRFDMTHMIGESQADPDLEKKGMYFFNWTYTQYESDMIGSLAYLQRRFQPSKKTLVSFSVSAIPARRMIADGEKPGVDLWIAPFGCPDGQDQFKNYMAGEDIFQKYVDGETLSPMYVYGRLGDPNGVVADAVKRKMAFLEDARNDMSNINVPVTWMVGTYDFIVTRERVRQMLNAPGGGEREIIELPAGHLLKTGPEAIESYKLISETIAKHLFCSDRPAIEPDMARFMRQNEAEWARIKRTRIENTVDFWDRHLFGTSEQMEGYDIFLYNPEYVDFMKTQAELLDVQPGERVIDLGCGTGNLSLAVLERYRSNEGFSLTLSDLVPRAVERAKEKIGTKIAERSSELGNIKLDNEVIDLEAARLTPVSEFLSGQLYGPVALAGRIEGLETAVLRKTAVDYGPRLHEILHGALSTVSEVERLCPSLDEEEAETILELSMASRFVKNETLPVDLRDGATKAATVADLRFSNLIFGKANARCRLDCESESFDKIGASIVLPYLFDPLSVVAEFHRILAPGGTLVVSSPKPNYDSSKSYKEEAASIAKRTDIDQAEKGRLLASLRELAAFVSHVLEMEDEGRFRFFIKEDLVEMIRAAGFTNVSTYDSLGDPATALIVHAKKGR